MPPVPRCTPRGYERALGALVCELDLCCPRPPELMVAIRQVKRYGNVQTISWDDLARMDAVHILARAATHLRGWPCKMVDRWEDVEELLEDLVGYGARTDGVLRLLIRRAPGGGAELLEKYVDLFGGPGESSFDHRSDEGLPSDDSSAQGREYRRIEGESGARDRHRGLIARTEYAHLLEFLGRRRTGAQLLEEFRAYLRRERAGGEYPFHPLSEGKVHELYHVENACGFCPFHPHGAGTNDWTDSE